MHVNVEQWILPGFGNVHDTKYIMDSREIVNLRFFSFVEIGE